MVDLPEVNDDGADNHETDIGHGEEAHVAEAEAADDLDTLIVARPGSTRQMKTVIGVCLDASGSMGTVREATIEAVNAFLREQAASAADDCWLTMCQFDSYVKAPTALHPIAHVPHLTAATYVPAGGTALYDAIARTVAFVREAGADADRMVIVIITDGEENQSRETTLAQVRELIATAEATGRWTFVYLSAALAAFTDGATAGFGAGNTMAYTATSVGTATALRGLSESVTMYRESSFTASQAMSGALHGADWTQQVGSGPSGGWTSVVTTGGGVPGTTSSASGGGTSDDEGGT